MGSGDQTTAACEVLSRKAIMSPETEKDREI